MKKSLPNCLLDQCPHRHRPCQGLDKGNKKKANGQIYIFDFLFFVCFTIHGIVGFHHAKLMLLMQRHR
jgi:hypothetical protein